MLHATAKAGDPQEYFNRYLLADERSRRGIADLSFLDLVELAEQESSTSNGVFGMHLHLSQLHEAYGSAVDSSPAIVKFLKSFDKFIWVRRRQRLYQAASWAIARQTEVFTSEQQGKPVDADAISSHDLVSALALVSRNDHGWKTIIRKLGLPHKTVWYEQLVENYEQVSRGVLEHLELSDEVPVIPPPPIEKQATEVNKRLASQLLSYLGVTAARL